MFKLTMGYAANAFMRAVNNAVRTRSDAAASIKKGNIQTLSGRIDVTNAAQFNLLIEALQKLPFSTEMKVYARDENYSQVYFSTDVISRTQEKSFIIGLDRAGLHVSNSHGTGFNNRYDIGYSHDQYRITGPKPDPMALCGYVGYKIETSASYIPDKATLRVANAVIKGNFVQELLQEAEAFSDEAPA